MPLRLGTSFGNARFGISTKWPKGISLGANIPLGVDPTKANKKQINKLSTNLKTPANHINRMMSQVKDSNFFSRPCLYKIEISPPTGIQLNAGIQKSINLNCDTVSVPGMNISTKPHRTYGWAREYAYETSFVPLDLSFYVSDDMREFHLFQQWMDSIITKNGRSNYFNEYAGTVWIHQCSGRVDAPDSDDLPVMMSVKLDQAFPKILGNLSLGHALRDQVQKLTVNLVYFNIEYYDFVNSEASAGVRFRQGFDHLNNAMRSFTEGGKMLMNPFEALKLPKLGTLLKKKESFLPGLMDSIRGGGKTGDGMGAPTGMQYGAKRGFVV